MLYFGAPVLGGEIYEGIANLDLGQVVNSYQAVDWQKVREGTFFLTLAAPALGQPQRIAYRFVRKQLGVQK